MPSLRPRGPRHPGTVALTRPPRPAATQHRLPPRPTATRFTWQAPWLRTPVSSLAVVGGSAPPPGASTFARADQTDRHIHLSRSGADAPPKHVLVCAPSNAAIDEIVSRLLQRCGGVGGLLDGDGARCAPG